jgi:peptide deformylase
MKLPLAYYPHPVLLQKTERVNYIDDELRQFVSDMFETMHLSNGIGLAAPQVFRSISLFVSCVPIQKSDGRWYRGRNKVFINPQIVSCSAETELSEEGCLSIPDVPVTITRSIAIHVRATDLTGQTFEETLEGLRAINFQHEYDHLQGKLILDYLTEEELKNVEPQLEKIKLMFTNHEIK